MSKKSTTRTAGLASPRGSSHVVGYRKPPIHSRFRPGESGNPRGRPKGRLNLKTELNKELNRVITIREGDRSRRLKKGAAWVVRTVNAALNNNAKANDILIGLMRLLLLRDQEDESLETSLTADDKALLADFLQRHGAAGDEHELDDQKEPSVKEATKKRQK
jgi:hypothetical protein